MFVILYRLFGGFLERKSILFRRGLREGEGNDAAASGTSGFRSSGGDDHKLATVYHIGARSGVATKRQCGLPKDCAGLFIKCPNGFVSGRADEDQPAGCYDRSAIVFGAGWWDAAGF